VKKVLTLISLVLVLGVAGCDVDELAESTGSGSGRSDDLKILSTSLESAGISGSYYVYVDVKNVGTKNFDYVGIDIKCFDSAGKVVGTGLGNTLNVGPGETHSITGVVITSAPCSRAEVALDDLTFLT
jgi:hypothetical protein